MSFSRQMRQWANNTGEDVDKLVRAVNLDLTRQVIQLTPVGKPSLWQTKYPPKGYTGGQAKGGAIDSNGESTEANALNSISRSVGSVYYIVNNLPYIRRLEYEGWSGQRPEGMVRVTVSEFNRRLERAARTIRR